MRSQGVALGWYALPRWGKWNDDVSDTGHQRYFRYRTPTTCPVPFLHRVSDTGPPPRFRFHALTAVPIPGLSTVFRIPCPDGASHTSPGCKPWESARKRNPRSEGTPHSRGTRTSTPPFPMRCSFRTHPFYRTQFPGRCPISANLFGIGATESCGVWVILTTRW